MLLSHFEFDKLELWFFFVVFLELLDLVCKFVSCCRFSVFLMDVALKLVYN